MPTASELLARTLKARGISTIFHITGAPNIQLTVECEKLGIALVGVRHEIAAAGMAFAYARVTGRAAVCLAPAGPGAVNMIPTAVHAMLGGSSPLATRGTGSFQELDQVVLFAPAVKHTLQVTRPGDIGRLFDEALAIATAPRQGPVYFDLPGDILNAGVDEGVAVHAPTANAAAAPPEAAEVEAILDALAAARRPLIVSGSGIIWSGASAAMEEFVNLTGVPFFTTPQGRGVISEDHDLALLGARTMAFREADPTSSSAT